MKVIIAPRLVRLLTGGFAAAIALWPFVLLRHARYEQDKEIIQHERIHLQQQKELFLVPFLIWYALEFLWHYCKCRDARRAYRAVCFEKEAFANEADKEYLKRRKTWAFLAYR